MELLDYFLLIWRFSLPEFLISIKRNYFYSYIQEVRAWIVEHNKRIN